METKLLLARGGSLTLSTVGCRSLSLPVSAYLFYTLSQNLALNITPGRRSAGCDVTWSRQALEQH